jgi:hypothetical protein
LSEEFPSFTTRYWLIHDIFRVTFSHIVTDTGLAHLVLKPGPSSLTKLVVSSQSTHLGSIRAMFYDEVIPLVTI